MIASAPEYGKYADEVLAKQMKPEVLKEIRTLESKMILVNQDIWSCLSLISIKSIYVDCKNGQMD